MKMITRQNTIAKAMTIIPKKTLLAIFSMRGLSHEVMRLPSRFHWKRMTNNAIAKSTTKSRTRSDITVPKDLSNGMFSFLVRVPQRVTSPRRGNTVLAKYAIKTDS